MSLRTVLAAAAVLAFAVPAAARQAPAAPPAAEAVDPAEAAMKAKAEAFGARIEVMTGEMQAAITAAGGDTARAGAALDAIQARYQPEADALAEEMKAFLEGQAAEVSEEERAGVLAALAVAVPMIKGVPAMVRGQVEQGAAAAAAPAAAQ